MSRAVTTFPGSQPLACPFPSPREILAVSGWPKVCVGAKVSAVQVEQWAQGSHSPAHLYLEELKPQPHQGIVRKSPSQVRMEITFNLGTLPILLANHLPMDIRCQCPGT